MFRLAVLTVSTSGFQGDRDDASGRKIQELLASPDYQTARYEVVPDDKNLIASHLTEWADSGEVDLIITTGGTGLGRQDITPEACLSVIDRGVPGLAETMRAETLKFTPCLLYTSDAADE